MHTFAPRGKQQSSAPAQHISIETLENRRLLSASIASTFDAVEPPVAAVDVNAHTTPAAVSPARTWLLAPMYSGSSKLTKSK